MRLKEILMGERKFQNKYARRLLVRYSFDMYLLSLEK